MLKRISIGLWVIFIGLVPIFQRRFFGLPTNNPIDIFFQVFGLIIIIAGILIILGIIKGK